MSSQFEKTLVLGHRGMVGSAVVRRMAAKGLPAPMTAGRQELDCLDQAAVRRYIAEKRPTSVVVAAAKVGGIEANSTQMSEFMYENLMVATNVVEACFRAGVPRVLFLGSSCIYPRLAPQPIREDALLTGPLEPSNEGYAIAKIAGNSSISSTSSGGSTLAAETPMKTSAPVSASRRVRPGRSTAWTRL